MSWGAGVWHSHVDHPETLASLSSFFGVTSKVQYAYICVMLLNSSKTLWAIFRGKGASKVDSILLWHIMSHTYETPVETDVELIARCKYSKSRQVLLTGFDAHVHRCVAYTEVGNKQIHNSCELFKNGGTKIYNNSENREILWKWYKKLKCVTRWYLYGTSILRRLPNPCITYTR
jgi:hypothetical protein